MKVISDKRWTDFTKLIQTNDGSFLHHKLIASVEKLVQEPLFDITKGNKKSNLYIVQNILLLAPLAYLTEKDVRYKEYVCNLIVSLCDRAWLCALYPAEIHWGYLISGASVAYDLLEDHLTDEESNKFKKFVEEIGTHIFEESKSKNWGDNAPSRAAWNHTAIPFSGLGLAALIFPELNHSKTWLEHGLEKVKNYLDFITEAGMTWEGLYYCGFVLRNVGLFLSAADNIGVYSLFDDSQNNLRKKLSNVPEMYRALQFEKHGLFQNMNDSHMYSMMPMFGFLSAIMPVNPSSAGEVWWRAFGPKGNASFGHDILLIGSSLFESLIWNPGPEHNYIWQRTDFECLEYGIATHNFNMADKSSSLIFNCGKHIGTVHDQSDNNHLLLSIGAIPVLLDGGYSNKPSEGSPASSYGHNLVLIDGRGQFPAGRGKGVDGEIRYIERNLGCFSIVGDASDSYNKADYNPVKHHLRHVVAIHDKDGYLIVFDDIEKRDGSKGSFDVLYHTLPPHSFTISETKLLAKIGFSRENLELQMIFPSGVDTISQSTTKGPSVSPIQEHATWRISRNRVLNPKFVSIISANSSTDSSNPVTVEDFKEINQQVELTIRRRSGVLDKVTFSVSDSRFSPIAPIIKMNI